jgi:hypothetical protein
MAALYEFKLAGVKPTEAQLQDRTQEMLKQKMDSKEVTEQLRSYNVRRSLGNVLTGGLPGTLAERGMSQIDPLLTKLTVLTPTQNPKAHGESTIDLLGLERAVKTIPKARNGQIPGAADEMRTALLKRIQE